jgi:hypothetical protein
MSGDTADVYTLEIRRRENVPLLASLKTCLDQVQPGLLLRSPMDLVCTCLQRH